MVWQNLVSKSFNPKHDFLSQSTFCTSPPPPAAQTPWEELKGTFILGDPGADSGDEGKSELEGKYDTKKSKVNVSPD